MPPGDIKGLERARLQPAADGHPAVPGVEAEHDPSGKGGGHLGEQLRRLDRHTAHDDAVHTGGQVAADRLERADAATELAGHARRGNHPAYKLSLRWHTVLRAVEVDDVQPPGAGRDEAAGHGNGILAEDGLPFIVPLEQSHALASPKIDRGPEFHVVRFRGFEAGRTIPATWRAAAAPPPGSSRDGIG